MHTKDSLTCKICKDHYDPTGLESELRKRLINVSICYFCDFWMEKWQMRNREDVARIKGQHFIIGDPNDKQKGMGGRKITIKFADGRTIHTNNLWHQGNIPSNFKIVLFDNAEFVK